MTPHEGSLSTVEDAVGKVGAVLAAPPLRSSDMTRHLLVLPPPRS
jgi:hypothetical protein